MLKAFLETTLLYFELDKTKKRATLKVRAFTNRLVIRRRLLATKMFNILKVFFKT